MSTAHSLQYASSHKPVSYFLLFWLHVKASLSDFPSRPDLLLLRFFMTSVIFFTVQKQKRVFFSSHFALNLVMLLSDTINVIFFYFGFSANSQELRGNSTVEM